MNVCGSEVHHLAAVACRETANVGSEVAAMNVRHHPPVATDAMLKIAPQPYSHGHPGETERRRAPLEVLRSRVRHETLHVERVFIFRQYSEDFSEVRNRASVSELPAREQGLAGSLGAGHRVELTRVKRPQHTIRRFTKDLGNLGEAQRALPHLCKGCFGSAFRSRRRARSSSQASSLPP